MSRFVKYVLIPFTAALLAAIQIPNIQDYFTKQLSYYWQNIIAAYLIAATVFSYYITINSLRKSRICKTLDYESKILRKLYPKMELSLNLMIPQRMLLQLREPRKKDPSKRKLCFNKFGFRVIWNTDRNPVDEKLKFSVNQGVCGFAYRKKKILGGPIEELKHLADFNFTTLQASLTSEIVVLVSYPVKITVDENTKKEVVKAIINVESRMPGSEALFEPKKRAKFYENIERISNIYKLLALKQKF